MGADGTSRGSILATLRRAASRTPQQEQEARAAVDGRIAAHARNLIPARGQLPPAQRVELFARMATGVAATVERVPGPARVPHAIADYLSAHNLAACVAVAPQAELTGLPWDRRPTLDAQIRPAAPADQVTVSAAVAGVAETGTCMLASGAEAGPTYAFLPGTHIVVLPAARIVGGYEEAWDLLRAAGAMPRAVNLVTGPSRTADIEQTPQVHAHGPGRLHILIVEGEGADEGSEPPGPGAR